MLFTAFRPPKQWEKSKITTSERTRISYLIALTQCWAVSYLPQIFTLNAPIKPE
jgi:hypothetical protein